MDSKSLKILIVDDHFFVRQGLKQVLQEHYKGIGFGEAADGQAALELIWHERWDVVLLDISMPGRGGLETLKDAKIACPSLPVIILSMHSEDLFGVRALKQGASGYLRKDSAGQELVKAVDAALAGKLYITQRLAENLAVHVHSDKKGLPHESLSDREHQVMCLIASGKTVKEVAGDIALSVKTVSTYRTRILEKLALKNTSQIMHYALQNGLIDGGSGLKKPLPDCGW